MNDIRIIVIIVLIGVITIVLFFNRTPKRIIPERGIISPSSGKIIEVRESENTSILFQKEGVDNHVSVPEISGLVKVILIQMSPKDVHVQRAPISGEIIRMDHYDGLHKNALGKEKLDLVEENEKVVTVFKNERDVVGVVQVAGRAARRIRNTLKVGSSAKKGDIYGRIILGSQTVVIIPANHEVLVEVGERVIDGETVIAE